VTSPTFLRDTRARHDKMTKLVEAMLSHSAGLRAWLHKELPKARTPHDEELIERQISATDKQIDALVYELYGLTESEIRIVEAGSDG
jgi:hypothetical protein